MTAKRNPSARDCALVATHPSKIIRPKAAADMLGTSQKTLRQWAEAGYGPPRYRTGPNMIGYRLGDLEEWIAAHREKVDTDQQGTADAAEAKEVDHV